MIVERDIYASYKEQVDSLTPEQRKTLAKECSGLCLWGERWGVDMEDAAFQNVPLTVLVLDENGEVRETEVYRIVSDLEAANRGILRSLDEQIVGSYRVLKKAGIRRPSSLLYGSFFMEMTGENGLDKYVERPDKVRGIRLVMQRLRSTCRVAFRFENKQYQRTVIPNEAGGVDVLYGSDHWRRELEARRVIRRAG